MKSSTDCPVDSNVNEVTWNAIYDVYTGIIDSLPDSAFVGTVRPYPGVPLRQGATGRMSRICRNISMSLPLFTPTYLQ